MIRFVLALASVALCVPATAQEARTGPPSITVAASAEREVVPDIAVLQLGVTAERKTAAGAADEAARAAQAVLEAVKAEGVEPRDLRATATVAPVYDEIRNGQGQVTGRSLRGYLARNALTVRLRKADRAGALARSLIDKGANALEGVRFEVGDRERMTDELRVAAVTNAMRRAALLADAAGVKLGRILAIDPGGPEERAPAAPFAASRAAAIDLPAAAIPIEPGIVTLAARVSITWELVQP
ncbi:MAG: SIMPL domain-containing protein [Methylobacteriaceae bacterium]|nr:SIMPL domain-containing protein [Methylobacteriaceae bacterium]